MTKIEIWRQSYTPFICGGDVHQPVKCEAEATGPFDIGKGFSAYVVTSPKGNTYIVESQTFGIVGDSIEVVRKDVEEADFETMVEQVESERQGLTKARNVSQEEFWGKM